MKGDFYQAIYCSKMYSFGRPVIDFVIDTPPTVTGPPIGIALEPMATQNDTKHQEEADKIINDSVEMIKEMLGVSI